MIVVTSLVAACFLVGVAGPTDDPAPGYAAPQDRVVLPRDALRCGPNAMYLYLKLNKVPVDFQSVESALTVTDKGVTLSGMRKAAAQLGVPSEIRRFTIDELRNCLLPCVAYFPSSYSSLATGHFVLVYDLVEEGEKSGIWCLDSTDGSQLHFSWARFPLHWDGYILQRLPPVWERSSFRWGTSMCFWCVAGLLLWRPRFRGPRAEQIVGLLVVGSWLFGSDVPAHGAQPQAAAGAFCRQGEKDGLNCLYLLLRTEGRNVDYEVLARSCVNEAKGSNTINLAQLARVGSTYLKMEIQRLAPDDLGRLTSPVICHLTGARGEGRFVLLVSRGQPGGKELVVTGTGELVELAEDEFRREWTGYALVLAPQEPGLIVAIASNAYVFAIYLYAGTLLGHGRTRQHVARVAIFGAVLLRFADSVLYGPWRQS
jgi:ABC-type bacteriocin/lantibiotic exporter with double-glycine peptidase domain